MGVRRTLLSKFWHYLPFGCFVAAVLCLCFAYGIAVGKWHVFPHDFLNKGWDSLNVFRNKSFHPHWIHPARYEGEGVVVYERDKVYPGVTLLSGFWKDGDDWNPGIRLVDLDGIVIHEWQCNPRIIWAQSPHNDYAAGSKDDKTKTFVHGVALLPNGDVVFNLEHLGLVRMSALSEVVWKLPYRTHHSIFQDEGGCFWVCGEKWHEDPIDKFVGLKPPFIEDTILRVSPDGTIEREISVLETIYRSGYQGLLFFNVANFRTGNILHLNDVEVLGKHMSDAFDIFHTGDIMISVRYINTVFMIDGETERIKWSVTHPFIGQHDPDFTEDGYITVFDNHDIGYLTPDMEHLGSRILRIEPSTKKVTVLYGHRENQYFYTKWCGKHQHLPNGNILTTETNAGRVFEIDADGRIVWSWITPRWSENTVSEVQEGTRYGAEYTDFLTGLRKDKK